MKTKMRNVMLRAMLVILMGAGTGYADLSDGLVAYYPFNGNANDESGNGNNGTIHGATPTPDRFGNPSSAYSFDGADDYIFVPDSDSLDLTTTGTLAAWVNIPNGAKDDLTAVVAKMIHSSGGGVSYELLNRLVGHDEGVYQTIAGDAHDGSSNTSAYYFHDMSDGKWHHLAFTWDGPEGKMYIDGQDATESADSGTGAMVSSFDLYIGRYFYTPHNTWYSWDGSIDEVRIYNRDLSADEVRGLINSPPVAVCQDVLVAVGANGYADASIDGGSYDPDGDDIVCSQNPAGPYPVGVYNVELTVTDPYGASDSCQAMLVVYDASGGFVTGGGWIWSPKGAYIANPWLEGKANFGFVSKYKKGANVPTGQTEFVFQAGDLNFHSSSYDWLVVTGSNYARFKGIGTINGSGEYKFMLWAGDGEPDTFRIRIWTEDDAGVETDVYDNGFDQAIGGGSIVIHKK